MPKPDRLYFLVAFEGATLAFDVTLAESMAVVQEFERRWQMDGLDRSTIRAAVRDMILKGFMDNDHIDKLKSQRMANGLVWYLLTSDAAQMNEEADGFMLLITRKKGSETNFRTAIADKSAVEEMTAKLRAGRKYIVEHTRDDVAKAFNRKRTPIPRDPSLDPPSKPNVDRWIPELAIWEKRLGKHHFEMIRDCMDHGAMFVWHSRQFSDKSYEEIYASLGAMAEYDRLHLPYPKIWAETRDWFAMPNVDGPDINMKARFAIAAAEDANVIKFHGFLDVNDQIQLSIVKGEIDKSALIDQQEQPLPTRSYVTLTHIDLPSHITMDESIHRRVTHACGERLMELLFMLSTGGIAREKIRQGSPQQKGKKKGQRKTSARDYTIIRVPMQYLPGGAGGGAGRGGWVRPHVRRAHMWGKHTRPIEEQHWRDACLVGAAKAGDDVEISRPEYRVG